MRKKFNLSDWLKDKSQKVETRCGFPVRIICYDRAVQEGQPTELKLCVLVQECGGETVYYYYSDGTKWAMDEDYDLFIVTPEPELTEFEKELESFYNHHLQVCTYDNQGTVEDSLHDGASKLLSLARKQLQLEIDALKEFPMWKKIRENGWNYSDNLQFVINGRYLEMTDPLNDVYEVSLSDLVKLPRFKED